MKSDLNILSQLFPNDREYGSEVRKRELKGNNTYMLNLLKQFPNVQDLGTHLRQHLWKEKLT